MKVLVECYPDWEVLHFLGVPRKQLLHEPSKGRIVTRLKDLPGVTGVVDEDPASARPRDLDSYQESSDAEGLRLLTRQGSGGQRLIVLCPRLEEWLMQRARSSGIKADDYGLPRDPDRLHSVPHYEQKEGFRQFLAALNNCDKGMSLLRRWVFQTEGS